MTRTFTTMTFTRVLRRLATLGALAAGLALTGCASTAPSYQPTNDNVRALQSATGGKLALGEFTAKEASLNSLTIRGGSFVSPYGGSFAEYLKAALKSELETAGKFDSASAVSISGELLTNALDAPMGTGSAHISARIVVKRGSNVIFDKVVAGDRTWESSFIGGIAIPAARQNYADTMKALLATLFKDKDFVTAL